MNLGSLSYEPNCRHSGAGRRFINLSTLFGKLASRTMYLSSEFGELGAGMRKWVHTKRSLVHNVDSADEMVRL